MHHFWAANLANALQCLPFKGPFSEFSLLARVVDAAVQYR
jgi:hypothetical protein